MTVAEVAKQLGKSHQAIYKRISKAGLQLSDLRDASTGHFTPQGVEALARLYPQLAAAAQAEKPVAQPVETDSTAVENLRNQVESLKQAAADATHAAELARIRAEAAENERDYLRQQLDAAIKASALASVKRLTAPEEQEPPQTFRERVKAAWAALQRR